VAEFESLRLVVVFNLGVAGAEDSGEAAGAGEYLLDTVSRSGLRDAP
jgi:hypothetical protein